MFWSNWREVELNKLGGLYTEADPADLPMGASPQNWDVDYLVGGVTTRPGLSNPITTYNPVLSGTSIIQWIKSIDLLGDTIPDTNNTGHSVTLMQDSAGGLWHEDVILNPGVMNQFYSKILNNARATSETVNGHEFICLSDFTQGQDSPRNWNHTYLDRVSQVGPGAPPNVQVISPEYPIVSITEIYQSHGLYRICWGAFISFTTAPPPATSIWFLGNPGDTDFLDGVTIGDIVYVSGSAGVSGQVTDGTYTVTNTGSFTDVNGTQLYWGATALTSVGNFTSSGGTYQKTQALVQLEATDPLPPQDAVVGNQVVISGASPAQWNRTWTIVNTPTEGQLQISNTVLSSNVATYTYSLTSGEAPGWQPDNPYAMGSQIVSPVGDVWQISIPGTSGGSIPSFGVSPQSDGTATWTKQPSTVHVIVTAFNTSNGGGVFNVSNAVITSATSTTFTVAITAPDVSSSSESGYAVSGTGTALIIDPGQFTLGTGNPGVNPIYGNSTISGQITATNSNVAAGERYAVLLYMTRFNVITPASPPVKFFTTSTTTQLSFSNLAVGPPNIIARIVAFTAANAGIGGPYFWIPDNVNIPGSAATLGQTTTINKTIVYDNNAVTTGALNISDSILTSSINISTTGNNLQQQRELAECVKAIQYMGRVFYLGELTKNDQFVNMTFDGGQLPATSGLPAGWTVSSGLAPYVSVATSLLFGQSLYIRNTSGSTINPTGTILANIVSLNQTAYQTPLQTPIIQPNTVYSYRITGQVPSQVASTFRIELYSPSLNQSWGANLTFSTNTFVQQTGSLGNPQWEPVPTDLQLRIYPVNMTNGADLLIDRMEVYLLLNPIYTQQVIGSYLNNPEAVDAITGPVNIGALTGEPLTDHFKFLDGYYLATDTRTFKPIQTSSEPSGWIVKEISNAAGSLGPLATDPGPEYVVVASHDGVYLFDGGSHVKIFREIQQIWNLMYFPSKRTVWVKNDIANQRIMIGLPMATPNLYLPDAVPNSAPAYPNIILMCSYLGLDTGKDIAAADPVTVSMFTGTLLFHDKRRKWTAWQIPAAVGQIVIRANGSRQVWYGQQGKISELDPTTPNDNGVAVKSRYTTFGFQDPMTAERFHLPAGRKLYPYSFTNIEGAGKYTITALPENINTTYPATQPPFTLSSPNLDDQNAPYNVTGDRCYLQIDSDGQPGTKWTLRRLVLAIGEDQRMRVTGR